MSTNDPPDGVRDDEPTSSETDEGLFDEQITGYPWLAGVLVGTWTFVAGYVLMGLVIVGSGGLSAEANLVKVLEDVGVTLYNAHNVVLNVDAIEANLINPGDIEGQKIDVLSGETRIPKVIYYAAPVVALGVAGTVLAWRTLPNDVDPSQAVLPAWALATGYTAFAVAGTFVLRPARTDPQGVVVAVLSPDLLQTFVFALLYSLVCGLLASAAVVGWRNREAIQRRLGV